MNFKKNLLTIIVVLAISFLVVTPGLWFPAIGLILDVMIFCLAARIVARVIFGKSLKELIFGDK